MCTKIYFLLSENDSSFQPPKITKKKKRMETCFINEKAHVPVSPVAWVEKITPTFWAMQSLWELAPLW